MNQDLELSVDEAKLIAWRYERARALGLDFADADSFAHGEGDISELEWLIRTKACPPELAARIAS